MWTLEICREESVERRVVSECEGKKITRKEREEGENAPRERKARSCTLVARDLQS